MVGKISSRKAEHIEICLNYDVSFKKKSTGFESLQLVHNALPELNYSEIDTRVEFLSKELSFPLMVSGITGGFEAAEGINEKLARVCQKVKIGLGLGSQRQVLENSNYLRSFSIVRETAPEIPIVSNIGAAQIVQDFNLSAIKRIINLVKADALAIHLNPLQEVLQPEGDPNFKGVLQAIVRLVQALELPVIVKETGAGISGVVAQRLVDAGIQYIDVAGAGGTSWAAVEYHRSSHKELAKKFWDWGLPTAWCLLEVTKVKGVKIISSGGIKDGIDIAKSIALGADMTAAARPLLKILFAQGEEGLTDTLRKWQKELKTTMFLTGCRTIKDLKNAKILDNSGKIIK